jgi:hypothetical protein
MTPVSAPMPAPEEGTLHYPTIFIVLFSLIRSFINNLMFLDKGMW